MYLYFFLTMFRPGNAKKLTHSIHFIHCVPRRRKSLFSASECNCVGNRVARYYLVHDTKTVKNVPNEHKMYPMVIKYPRCLQTIPKGHKVHRHFLT
jgi:hypothetical protein